MAQIIGIEEIRKNPTQVINPTSFLFLEFEEREQVELIQKLDGEEVIIALGTIKQGFIHVRHRFSEWSYADDIIVSKYMAHIRNIHVQKTALK